MPRFPFGVTHGGALYLALEASRCEREVIVTLWRQRSAALVPACACRCLASCPTSAFWWRRTPHWTGGCGAAGYGTGCALAQLRGRQSWDAEMRAHDWEQGLWTHGSLPAAGSPL